MVQTELNDELAREPFAPLRLHLSNGETFDIQNPGLVWVTRDSVFIARSPLKPAARAIEGYDLLSLVHIVRLERVEDASRTAPA